LHSYQWLLIIINNKPLLLLLSTINQYYCYHYYLVGGFNPSEKYESQLGWLFLIYGKNKTWSKPPPSYQLPIINNWQNKPRFHQPYPSCFLDGWSKTSPKPAAWRSWQRQIEVGQLKLFSISLGGFHVIHICIYIYMIYIYIYLYTYIFSHCHYVMGKSSEYRHIKYKYIDIMGCHWNTDYIYIHNINSIDIQIISIYIYV
jgi:hypothetical protein